MLIKLNQAQLNKCVELAQARHNAKNASFRNSKVSEFHNEAKADLSLGVGIDSEYMPHFIGLLGEMAWSIHSGLPVDEEIYAVRDGGQDFDGIEVKTITYFGKDEPELKIPVKEYVKRNEIKTYVLVRVDVKRPQNVEILGTISREDFDDLKVEKKYGRYKPTNYTVPVSKMEPV